VTKENKRKVVVKALVSVAVVVEFDLIKKSQLSLGVFFVWLGITV